MTDFNISEKLYSLSISNARKFRGVIHFHFMTAVNFVIYFNIKLWWEFLSQTYCLILWRNHGKRENLKFENLERKNMKYHWDKNGYTSQREWEAEREGKKKKRGKVTSNPSSVSNSTRWEMPSCFTVMWWSTISSSIDPQNFWHN